MCAIVVIPPSFLPKPPPCSTLAIIFHDMLSCVASGGQVERSAPHMRCTRPETAYCDVPPHVVACPLARLCVSRRGHFYASKRDRVPASHEYGCAFAADSAFRTSSHNGCQRGLRGTGSGQRHRVLSAAEEGEPRHTGVWLLFLRQSCQCRRATQQIFARRPRGKGQNRGAPCLRLLVCPP